jgi:outer membrane protein assembly factor BamB
MLRALKKGAAGAILLLFFAAFWPYLYAFQLSDVKPVKPWDKPIPLCWTFETEALVDIPPVTNAKGFLYIAVADGGVTAVDAATGKQAWHSGLGGEIEAMEPAENGRIIAVTRQEGEQKDKASLFINALSDESGVTAWRKELEFSEKFYLLAKGKNIFIARENGSITAFNAADGEIAWQAVAKAKLLTPPVLFHDIMVMGVTERKIEQISLENGKALQSFEALTVPNGLIAATNDLIIYSDQIGNIFGVRFSTGELAWKARAGAEVSDISVTDHGVLISSNDNFAYMLSPTRGDRKWKRKFAGRLVGSPVLRENYGLFVTAAGTEGLILNLTNGKFANNVSLFDEAYFTGASTGILDGFSLFTSRGTLFYSPGNCKTK